MAQIIHLEEISSTNEYLAELLRSAKPEEGTCVWADFQTAGKGQASNFWESERGQNLTFSLALYPENLDAHNQFIVSQLVSVAVADVLKAHGIADLSIKWSNDIYAGDRKIAGILIENSVIDSRIQACVVGIGLNINQQIFRSTARNPISMRQLTGKIYDIQHILSELCAQIFFRYAQLINNEDDVIRKDYLKMLYRKDGFHPYKANGKCFDARIVTICYNGYLLLQTRDGDERKFAFKEIEFIL